MTADERRNQILEKIRNATSPLSGSVLAKTFQVSRQIIVQDIAIIRTAGYDIYSTPKGYVLSGNLQNQLKQSFVSSEKTVYRVIKVSHSDEQMEDELNTIVDNGGKVLDVSVEHEVYGSIKADLNFSCRRQVREFIEDIQSGKSKPLKNLASGEIHYHKIEAQTENLLDLICSELKAKGYLL